LLAGQTILVVGWIMLNTGQLLDQLSFFDQPAP
jgi:hypothetical protein